MRFTIDEIAEVLLHNPALEELDMVDAIREGRTRAAGLPRIALPTLTRFSIQQRAAANGCPSSFELLSRMQLPAVNNLSIVDRSLDTPAQVSQAFDCILSSCAASPILALAEYSLHSDRDCFSARNEHPPPSRFGFTLVGLRRGPLLTSDFPSLHLSSTYDARPTEADASDTLAIVLRRLKTSGISDRIIELRWCPHRVEVLQPDYWNTVLQSFPNVSHIEVRGEPALTTLFDILGQHCNAEPDCVLPRLQSMKIGNYYRLENFPSVFPWSAHFEWMLGQRATAGLPIREIRFENLVTPASEAQIPRYAAVVAYMEDLARRLGVGVAVQVWKSESGSELGTTFVLEH
ncbi:unnamed protein product [Peniophora sp. CBMAI 1063]|nr:unnamed protein product [Peniophora sp. CBMAI 1063]